MESTQQPSNYRVSVKAIVRDAAGRILLVKEDIDAWGLPGGGIDHGETVIEGLRRELREEIGAEIAAHSEVPVLVETIYVQERQRHGLWLVYEVELAGEATVGPHSQAIGWFELKEIDAAIIDRSERAPMMKLMQLLGKEILPAG